MHLIPRSFQQKRFQQSTTPGMPAHTARHAWRSGQPSPSATPGIGLSFVAATCCAWVMAGIRGEWRGSWTDEEKAIGWSVEGMLIWTVGMCFESHGHPHSHNVIQPPCLSVRCKGHCTHRQSVTDSVHRNKRRLELQKEKEELASPREDREQI